MKKLNLLLVAVTLLGAPGVRGQIVTTEPAVL